MKVEKVMYLSPDFNNHNVPTPLVPADYFEANPGHCDISTITISVSLSKKNKEIIKKKK